MSRIASGVICVFASILLLISAAASATNDAVPNSALAGLAEEIKRVESEIDEIFAGTLAQLPSLPRDTKSRMKRVQTLGKLLLFDKQLSVNRNEACTFCHMPDVDFTGPISILNKITVSYPGSVRDISGDPASSRYGHRKPQSYTYAAYYPPLLYRERQKDFYGGNFWDLRATGVLLQNSAAEQAQDPPIDPNEMGMSDTACIVRRLSQSPYKSFFERIWGAQSFAITWPVDVDHVCDKPGRPADR
jgi:cytochrome c peroxidase